VPSGQRNTGERSICFNLVLEPMVGGKLKLIGATLAAVLLCASGASTTTWSSHRLVINGAGD
jgi:hypothetical protein